MGAHSLLVAWTAIVCTLLVACGDDAMPVGPGSDAGAGRDGSAVDGSGSALDGGSPLTSVSVSPAGGTVTSPDGLATLVIPPGALATETTITVSEAAATAETAAKIYDFGPNGLTFAAPAILTITGLSAPASGEQNVVAMDEGDGFGELPGISLDAEAIGRVDGFSRFTVVVRAGIAVAQSECPDVASGFTACGGEESGDYVVTRFCFQDAPLGPDPLRGRCPTATLDVDLPFNGTVSLDGANLNIAWGAIALGGMLRLPKTCTFGLPCTRLPLACTDTGESCACAISSSVPAGSIDDTYTAAGNAMSATTLGSVPYCAGSGGLVAQVKAPIDFAPLFSGAQPTVTFELERNICSGVAPVAGPLLADPGFETVDPGLYPRSGALDVWEGAASARVGTTGGVAPHGGANMLQFLATNTTTGATGSVYSVIEQTIDVSSHAAEIDSGAMTATARGFVNRVAGTAATDRRFGIQIYPGATTPVAPSNTHQGYTLLFEPGWQPVNTSHPLPVGTRAITVRMFALEDVLDDAMNEFDGHFADDISLDLACGSCGALPPSRTFGGNEMGPAAGGFEPGTSYAYYTVDSSADWRGDEAAFVGPGSEVSPRSGAQMLQFVASGASPAASSSASSELFHVIDLAGRGVSDGNHMVHARAFFNRVAGDAETDTRFDVQLWAFPGDAANFRTDWRNAEYTTVTAAVMLEDADPSTWSCLTEEMLIPAGTGYVVLELVAQENVMNDSSGSEFDGHYVDDVEVRIEAR